MGFYTDLAENEKAAANLANTTGYNTFSLWNSWLFFEVRSHVFLDTMVKKKLVIVCTVLFLAVLLMRF
jgi:hypothetical protein